VLYRILADLVVVAHLSFIAFVAVGSLLVWKWPRLVWPHVAVVAWAAAIVTERRGDDAQHRCPAFDELGAAITGRS
jgi:hypothetical protein